jgi:hypothetical protein
MIVVVPMQKDEQQPSLAESSEQIPALPVLSFLKAGLKRYLRTSWEVLKAGPRFALRWTEGSIDNHFRVSLSNYLYGNVLAFVVYVPIVYFWNLKLRKTYFIAQIAYEQLIVALLSHLAMRVFAGKGKLKQTITAGFSLHAVALPFFIALTFPFWAYVPVEDFSNPPPQEPPGWLLLWLAPVMAFFFIWSAVLHVAWMATLHRLSKFKALLAVLLVMLPLFFVHEILVRPYAAKVIRALSEMAQIIAE